MSNIDLCEQSKAVLGKLIAYHRETFVNEDEGCNQNDVERDFLNVLLSALDSEGFLSEEDYLHLESEIDKIR